MYCSPTKVVVARNVHRCTNCAELINKGELYITCTSVEDHWTKSKMHLECYESLIEDEPHGFEYMLYSGERPERMVRVDNGQ